jgi:hypothetical protein
MKMSDIIRIVITTIYKYRQRLYFILLFILIFGIIMLVTKENELIMVIGYLLIAIFGAFFIRYILNQIFIKKE